MLPNAKRNSDLQTLLRLAQEAKFSVAEPVYTEPSFGHYLAIFNSGRLYVKFSHDSSELYVWVKSAEIPDEWFRLRAVVQLLLRDRKINSDPSASFVRIERLVEFLIAEHEQIADLFLQQDAIKMTERVRKIEEEERSVGLRSLGMKNDENKN